MIKSSCHCGTVEIEVDTAPETVTDCNCSVCRRYGVLWAYYSPKAVRISPANSTDSYEWGDKSLEFHRCKICGCVTHWQSKDKSRDRMGVNARLMPPEILAQARVRHLDGADTWKYLNE
jgi:hypothetical protein